MIIYLLSLLFYCLTNYLINGQPMTAKVKGDPLGAKFNNKYLMLFGMQIVALIVSTWLYQPLPLLAAMIAFVALALIFAAVNICKEQGNGKEPRLLLAVTNASLVVALQNVLMPFVIASQVTQ